MTGATHTMLDDEDLVVVKDHGTEGEHAAAGANGDAAAAGGSSRYGANLSGRQYAMIVAGLGLGTALEW